MSEDKSEIKAFSLEALSEHKSYKRISQLNQNFNSGQEAFQYFIRIPNKFVNLFFFCIFGDPTINNKKYKDFFNNIPKEQRKQINIILNGNDFAFSKNEKHTQGKISFKKLQRQWNKIQQHLKVLQKGEQFWNKVTPNALNEKYPLTLFKLQKFNRQWLDSQKTSTDKKQIVLGVQQDKDTTILCFFELQKPQKSEELNEKIDKILLKQNAKSQNNKKSKILQPSRQSGQVQQNNQINLQKQDTPRQIDGQDQQQQELNEKEQCKQFWKDKMSIFWVLIIMILIPLVVQSLGTGYSKMDPSASNLNILEVHLIKGKRQFDQAVIKPVNELIGQILCQEC